MTTLQQLWQFHWPSGIDKPIGALSATPDELSERFSLKFRRGVDDLDSYVQVCLRLPSGRVVQLLRYDVYQEAGTMLFVDRDDDSEAARRELLSVLGTTDDALAWTQ